MTADQARAGSDSAQWTAPIARLLGKQVRVTLDDDEKVIVEGKLLGFSEGGTFEILEDDGFVHYCWPLLDITEAPARETGKEPYREAG